MAQKQSPPAFSLFRNPEKILIALIVVSIILFYFGTGERELRNSAVFTLVLSLEILLALYYSYLIRNVYALFLGGMVLLNAGYLLLSSNPELSQGLIIAGKASYFIFGIFLGYKTVKDSISNKDFELFGFLLTLALLFPLVHHLYKPLSANQDYLMVYHFALAFLLSTIMYNENLWDKYSFAEKKILVYVLVCTIAEVLFYSVTMI